MVTKKVADDATHVTIPSPNLMVASFTITGTAPYVQHKFSEKARKTMHDAQEAGSQAKKGKKKTARDFWADYTAAMHASSKKWYGIPAGAFRCAMVSACRIVGFKMTLAKLGIFILADGFDADEGTPLIKITKGKPEYSEHAVRLPNGSCDLRARPMWNPGWEAVVRIRYDGDMFDATSVANLMMRVGEQVGIGEGRPDSPNSCGMGWGTFSIAEK